MSSNLVSQFRRPKPKTVQIVSSGGGAHGAYEWEVLKIIVRHCLEHNFQIKLVTGVSTGAINNALLISGLNQGKDFCAKGDAFWNENASYGDSTIATPLKIHSLANTFNIFASQFPNLPQHWMAAAQMMGRSSLPLDMLKDLLLKYIDTDGWNAIRSGKIQSYIKALLVHNDGRREPQIFTREQVTYEACLATAALRVFAPYRMNGKLYEDGGYHQIGFFLKNEADILFAIGLKPLRNVAEFEDHRGIKTGQLHHDLARYYLDPTRTSHIDFICMDPPAYWNETSAMNNTSENINMLREMGRRDALKWIAEHGATFGEKSSFTPSEALLNHVSPQMTLKAA